ncbi:hypothetical protein K1719_020345 [Acacia pycnantha]|nr:hypothetical protein K1719_020345 [Acacia pycnantha]
MGEAGMSSPEVIVGELEEAVNGLSEIDFLVVNSRRKDFSRVLRLAKLSRKGAALISSDAATVKKALSDCKLT